MVINNPQNNTPVEWVNQDIYNMIVTNYLSKKLFIYIDTCHYILPCVSCLMTAYYHNTLKLKTVKTVFSGEIIFNLLSILDCLVITLYNQWQSNIYNDNKNSYQIIHDVVVGNIFYVDKTGKYHKLYY